MTPKVKVCLFVCILNCYSNCSIFSGILSIENKSVCGIYVCIGNYMLLSVTWI